MPPPHDTVHELNAPLTHVVGHVAPLVPVQACCVAGAAAVHCEADTCVPGLGALLLCTHCVEPVCVPVPQSTEQAPNATAVHV